MWRRSLLSPRFLFSFLREYFYCLVLFWKNVKGERECWKGVSIKSLYNFKNLLQRQIKRQISENYYKMRRIYLSFFLSYLIHLYTCPISCTKHIKTVLDYVLGRPLLALSNTVPVFINFLCRARIDGDEGRSLPYLVLKFRWACRSDLVSTNRDTHCAFSWGVAIL